VDLEEDMEDAIRSVATAIWILMFVVFAGTCSNCGDLSGIRHELGGINTQLQELNYKIESIKEK
jgi:hypothetical protein